MRGLEVSLGSLLEDLLVQRQVGYRLAQPGVLGLQLLQAPHLVALQPAKLSPPPILGHLRNPNLADRIGRALAL